MDSIEVDVVNDPDLMTLLPQVFGVSQTGIAICLQVTEEEQATTDDIATALDINRSTVSRQLNQLRELGVVERHEQSLTEGGQIHVYTPVEPEEMRRRHREGLLSWVTDAVTLVNELDRRKLEAMAGREQPESSLKPSADE